MNDIQNKTIVIQSVQDAGTRISLKGSDNLTYSFFKTKKDGSSTNAYNHYRYNNHNEQFNVGDSVKIGYTEQESENQGRKITYRNIISMFPSQEVPVIQTQPTKEVTNETTNWERIGRLKALHNLAGRRIGSGVAPSAVLGEIPQYKQIADRIEQIIDGVESSEEAPMIEDIPF